MSTPPPAPARATFAGLDDNDALPPGTRFGELEIIRVVGVGGFGIVYLAQDHALEREVALKEYMPGTLAGRSNGKQVSVHSDAHAQTYALGLRSFVNEARLLARFNHPSLVKVYRFWEENGTAYMVMPFLQGRTLREVRKSMGQAPDQAWILSVINPMMDALEQLHREAVYHRDIAPDNVLLPPNELPVLLDFGAARRAISDRTQTFTAILKPSYAPIEQYAESTQMRQGPWTDIYALGAVIHYLLKGSPPPPATSRALQEDVSSLATENLPGTSADFRAAVDWMLSLRPGDRPQSIADLREVLQGRAPVPAHATRGPSAPAQPPGQQAYTTFAPTMKVGGLGVEPATQVVGRAGTQAAPPAATQAATASATAHAATFPATSAATSAQSAFAETAIYRRPPGNDDDETLVIREALKGRSGQTGIHTSAHTSSSTVRTAAVIPPPARNSRLGLWLVIGACLVLLIGMGAWMMFFDGPANKPIVNAPVPASAATPVAVQTPPAVVTPPPVATPATTASQAEPTPVASAETAASAAVAPPAPVIAPPVTASPTVAPTTARSDAEKPVTRAAERTPEKAAEVAESNPRGNRLTPAEVRQAAKDAREARARAQQRSSPESTPPTAVYGDNRSTSARVDDPGSRRQAAARETAPAPVEAAPVRTGPSSPREACGNRVFIALDICMENQCKDARFASHPQCVRVREIEERRRRPDY